VNKKSDIAKAILLLPHDELAAMADDFVEMKTEAEDDGSSWKLNTKNQWMKLLRTWASGLGSMEKK
jgi:hypothetical protein